MANENYVRSELTAIYNTIQTSIDDLVVKFRNKTDDIISTMLNITIEGLCSNNVKNRMYMQRLMRINYTEEQSTRNLLGNNAVKMGNSSVIDEKPNIHVSYTQDINYIDNVLNTDGLGKTINRDNSQTYNEYYKGEVYNRTKKLVPDELNQLSSEDTWVINNSRTLLYQTKKLFNDNKINSLISRFCTGGNGYESGVTDENDIVSQYGMSRGRNLLLKNAEEQTNGQYLINGYNNPYCRVWTHHYQYDRLDKLIRPFATLNDNERNGKTIGEPITKREFHEWDNFSDDEQGYWKTNNKGWDYSVLNDNGFVNIAPKYDPIESKKVHTKQCMFSIENLAWKGYDPYSFEQALSWEQRGPMGGRIMWFPPYGISFNETTQANWSNHTFIGRGEDVYTYTNTVRSGTLSFMMVVDHPSIIDYVSHQYGVEDKVKDTDLLRFFAGCDSSTLIEAAKPTPLTDEYTEPTYKTVTEKEKQLPPEREEKEIPEEVRYVSFYVFFPNNYSGVYDTIGSNVEAIAYLLNGVNSQKKKNDSFEEDVSIKFDNLYEFDGIGYEMSSSGITDSNSDSTGCIFGTKNTWNNIMSKNVKTYPINKNKQWWYRIDGEYKIPKNNGDVYKNTYDQTLVSQSNYKDNTGYSLNSDAEVVKQVFNDTNNENIYSLREIAAALSNNNNIKDFLTGYKDDERVNKLIELFNNKDMKVSKISGVGFSNSHGNNTSINVNKKRNITLARERVNTVINWLKYVDNEKYKDVVSNVDITSTSYDDSKAIKTNDASSIEAKKYRSAKITIEFTTDKKTTVSDSDIDIVYNDNIISDGTQEYIGYTRYYDIYGREYFKDKDEQIWVKITDENDLHYGEIVMGKFLQNGSVVGLNELNNERYGFIRDSQGNIIDFNGDRNKIRYDQEYHFFKVLKQSDPIIFDKLMDKIRYFDPAFHSMTPEGFNARLTFLQQCTRQGNTIGASDTGNNDNNLYKTASNLAFGRPPFCVLRLGDFYNQMIVIDNISVNYDPLVWDLNIEGIGVQPLLANITISFKFIGGGDMTGPIKRLQNAMTFNYYSNARLYDNRADRIVYKSNTNNKEQGAIGNDTIDYNKSDFYIAQMYKKE